MRGAHVVALTRPHSRKCVLSMGAHSADHGRMFTVNQILNALRDSGPDGAEVRVASAWTVQKVANGDVPGITDDWIRKNLRDALSKWLEHQRHQSTAREVTYPRRWE